MKMSCVNEQSDTLDRKRKLPKNMDHQLKRRKCDISCIEMWNWLTDLHIYHRHVNYYGGNFLQ